MPDATLKQIELRLKALEAGVTLNQLPLKALREKVLFDQPSDPTQLILPKSVVGDLIADENIEESHLSPSLRSKLEI